VLVDGDRFEGYLSPTSGDFVPHACVIEGDGLYLSVAAASVLAKTHRDAYVVETLHPRFPAFGWDRNKGYGTPPHLAAIAAHGNVPCEEHRRTFRPFNTAPRAVYQAHRECPFQ
jgi:ribonuclease HII